MQRIAIHSAPRSGSTWLGNIFNSHPQVIFKYQPLFSYAFKGTLGPQSSEEEIINFFDRIAQSGDPFINQKEGIAKGIIPQFSKNETPTHICYKEVRYHHLLNNLLEKDKAIKVVGLVRNPLAVIHSWLKAPKEFKKELGWKMEEEWRFAPKKNLDKPEEFNGYEKWKEATLLFERLKKDFPKRFYLITYEALLNDTKGEIKQLFDFVGLDFAEQTESFIEKSRSSSVKYAYGVFKQKNNDDKWKTELPEYIIKEIENDLKGTQLEKYL